MEEKGAFLEPLPPHTPLASSLVLSPGPPSSAFPSAGAPAHGHTRNGVVGFGAREGFTSEPLAWPLPSGCST